MRVAFSPFIDGDLEQIGDYIALDDPERAHSFVQELIQCTLELATFPERFPLVPRYAKARIRRRSYGRYLIFYRVDDEEVRVLRVVSAVRNYSQLLDQFR